MDLSRGAIGIVLHAKPEWIDALAIGFVGEQLIQAVNDKAGGLAKFAIRQSFDDDFRTDACGITHGDADGRLVRMAERNRHVLILRNSRPPSEARLQADAPCAK
jgi:hypothetical protein